MINNVSYLLALHSIDGLGPIRLKAILDYFKDPKLAWNASENDFLSIGLPKSIIQKISEARKTLNPDDLLATLKKDKIKFLTILDNRYPALLKEIYDPPIVFYYKGDETIFNNISIAVVGTRKITGYGRVVTEHFVSSFVAHGLVVTSGLARGVDSEAHRVTLKNSGKTIAVLGGGLNNIYPYENISLAEEIIAKGGIVLSEFSPNAPSMPGNFPARNRIISGLSKGVLVIEAALDSGSLITARIALEQGREVFAVPGPVTSELSKGPARLIKEGAILAMEPEDVYESIGVKKYVNTKSDINLSDDEKMVINILEQEDLHVDEISRKLGWSISKASAALLKMEIAGTVRNLGGGTYCKG